MTAPVNILLVEDDVLDQIQVRRALDQKGIVYLMNIARDGEEALEMLATHERPDVILLDINMPRMNGAEFLNELRKRDEWNACHIFILTSSEQERHKMNAFGISGYIVKPLRLNSPSMDAMALMIDIMNLPKASQ